jgi:hypothetical protein
VVFQITGRKVSDTTIINVEHGISNLSKRTENIKGLLLPLQNIVGSLGLIEGNAIDGYDGYHNHHK